MGGCFTKKRLPINTTTNEKECKNKDEQKPASNQAPTIERASNGADLPAPPPPPPDDEAVVKEVLTETPLPSRTAEDSKCGPAEGGSVPVADDDDLRSCSASESFSASTTMAGDATEEVEVETAGSGPPASNRRPRELLPQAGKGLHQRRRSTSGEFPSWRGVRGGPGRAFPGREATRASLQQVGNRGGSCAAAKVVRGDQGERSGRRSASPAARQEVRLGAAGGRGGSGRGGNRSGTPTRGAALRRRPAPAQGGREAGEGIDVRWERGRGEEEEEVRAAAPVESLENPVVSLECFIFL